MTMIKVVTTGGKAKKFAWSYSKLKNFEACPKKYYNVDVAKTVKEEDSEQLQYGNMLHKHLANAIGGKAELPPSFSHLQPWVDRATGNDPDRVLVEQQLAITEEFGPTDWFGKDAWFRGIADVIKIKGQVAAVMDWKTGKIKEDGVQLALMAACVFAHHPEIQSIRTEFIWLKEDATSRCDFQRSGMPAIWNDVMPRVRSLEHAHANTEFPAKPGYLCRKWCPVESCPHFGE
jgi:hypothetical protein